MPNDHVPVAQTMGHAPRPLPAFPHNWQGMQEHEYLPLIPREELRRIKALLKRIHTARGWQGTPLEVEQAWAQALQAARTPAGGAWADMFQPEDLQPARLQRLASVLDEVFLSGALSRRLRRLKQRPLGFVVDDDFPGVCDWWVADRAPARSGSLPV